MSEDTRFCRFCRAQRPVSQFDEEYRCRPCAVMERGTIAVRLDLPGWETNLPGLMEMRVPSEEERAEYQGDLWTATRDGWRLQVLWRGDHGRYLCKAIRLEEPEEPAESRVFDYPHEVVDWITVWVGHIDKRVQP